MTKPPRRAAERVNGMGKNLLTVKSLVTLALTAAFIALLMLGKVTQEFITIYTVVIGFYFGCQKAKDHTATATSTSNDQSTTYETEEADADAV